MVFILAIWKIGWERMVVAGFGHPFFLHGLRRINVVVTSYWRLPSDSFP